MTTKMNNRVTLHTGRTFQFVVENVTFENGTTVDLEIVRHPGAAAIVPFVRKDTLILIKQYRHAVGDFIWEIPAGTLAPRESPIECAKRELTEETGYFARKWEKLGEITPVPGYSDERIYLYMADHLMPAEQHLDTDEILDVHEVDLMDAANMVYQGKIQDSKSISGLFLALNKLNRIRCN
jgi:ADP-ribose pyrophosphatase